ncbi:hypothetical protein H4R18_003030 [Coemansia javaensis]|uniref:Uncharacterized protein n=1 Tax=Coemansia javaensis TaxID=2761396 RepID=A0A9W8HD77_9FUNG|nr:hypothetical protein H4R18_003030 [Coemansia javaensis]
MDVATIAVGSGLFAATSALVAYGWCNHRYQPIRAKNLPQTTLMVVCGAVWFAGNVAANGHVRADGGGVWARCRLWHVWIRMAFEFLFFCCVLARIAALYWLLVRRKRVRGWSSFVPFAALVPCIAAFCIVGQLIPPWLSVWYDPGAALCLEARVYRACGLALLWAVWGLVIVFTWLARNIQSSFNEARTSLMVVAAMLVSLLQTTVDEAVHAPVAAHRAARIASTCTDFVVANLVVWILLAHPVYQSLFNRKRYSANWRSRLVSDGFRREYALSVSTVAGAGSMCSVPGVCAQPQRAKCSADRCREQSWIFRHSLQVRFSQTFGKDSTDAPPSLNLSCSTMCASSVASPSESTDIPRAA